MTYSIDEIHAAMEVFKAEYEERLIKDLPIIYMKDYVECVNTWRETEVCDYLVYVPQLEALASIRGGDASF